jgi:hypothetical protein
MKAGAAVVAAPTLVSGGKSTLRLDCRFPSICPCTASFTALGAHDNDLYPEEPREGKARTRGSGMAAREANPSPTITWPEASVASRRLASGCLQPPPR